MDYTPIIQQAFKLWWVIPIIFVLSIFRAPWFKGLVGEALVKFAARLRLPANTYHPIHNLTLPTPEGSTQIDHVFVSRFGIFVVETKNMKGWIYGGANQPQWTQKLFKKSYKFQNPLRQNYKHVKALEGILDLPADTIQSVVVFAGESTFKTQMPANVTKGGGYIRYIKSFSTPVLSDEQVEVAAAQIQSHRLAPTRETHRQHVQQLRERSEPAAKRACPKCGNAMVLRTAKRGENAGTKFWGCSAYPRCRAVQDVS